MATYALTFATRAAFDTSLASGDIYDLMQGVTSSKPSVAITATITESGETFACGTNVMVDIKSVGPGDYVLYDTTNAKYFGIASKWIDNNYPNQPTQHIMIFKTGVLPARYVVCGTVIKRFGPRIRLAGSMQSLVWADDAWGVSTIPSTTDIIKKSRTTTTSINESARVSFPSLRYLEARYAGGDATFLPITRSTWDAAVAAGNTTVTQNSKTATLADYSYNYDKFLAFNYSPLFPASSGAFSDTDGMGNTRKIVADFIANHSKTDASADYAAGYCYNYTPGAAPGLEKHAWFLGSIKDVGEVRHLTHTLVVSMSWGSGRLLSSSNISDTYVWAMLAGGYTDRSSKTSAFYSVPLADLVIEN